jgi:DNA invertase Pin-like site-specific DNA recombinase
MHLCDARYKPGDITNRRCCNPAHLSPGTRQENQRHMAKVGRSAKGDRSYIRQHPECYPRGMAHPKAKLTDEDVRRIRMETGPQSEIARSFGIDQARVSRIKARKLWAHIQ